MNAAAAVECRGLVKEFSAGLRGQRVRAVDGVTFSVKRGEIFGLLGANGCGKSTTLKMVAGISPPTAGECRVFGERVDRPEVRQRIGYAPDAPEFYRFMTASELLRFYAKVCGCTGSALERSVAAVLQRVGLADVSDRKIGTFSKGMLQRITLAQTLVHDPELLILDEPVAGVDPIGVAEIGDLLRELKEAGKTILLTSHLLTQVAALCDRVAIMDRGRILALGSLGELSANETTQQFATDRLEPHELCELRAWFAARGRSLRAVGPHPGELESVFRRYVGGNGRIEAEREA